jgi:hypothetical protein
MGSMGYWQEKGKEHLLASLFNGDYECIVRLIGTDKETGESKTGEYKLYKQFDKAEVVKYAKETSKNSNVNVSKIEVLTLTPSSIKEILL